MATDPVTLNASTCTEAEWIALKRTDPVEFLRKLPVKQGGRGLFSDAAPADAGNLGAMFDEEVILGEAIIGVVPGDEPTPQYEIARNFVQERDFFAKGLEEAHALQLGLGTMESHPGGVVGESPRASGRLLDRLGEQYGIGRPGGFTDCCYWKLLLLLLFQPGPTLWKLREICALYTGQRPMAVETPCKIVFVWPDSSDSPGYLDQSYLDLTCWFDGTSAPAPGAEETHGFGSGGGVAKTYNYYLGQGEDNPFGLALIDALNLVRPAGVYISLQNPPDDGEGGCSGASFRSYEDPVGTFYFA